MASNEQELPSIDESTDTDASHSLRSSQANLQRNDTKLTRLSDLTKDRELESEFLFADGYEFTVLGQCLKWLLFLCTGGIAGLIYLWFIQTNFFFHRRCRPERATIFLIFTNHKTWVSADVKIHVGIKYFQFNGLRYIFNGKEYVLAATQDRTWTHRAISKMGSGLTQREITPFIQVNESENLIVVPVPSFAEMALHELLDPNNIYIYLCCLLWFVHDYQIFAACILFTSIMSSLYTVYTTRSNRLEIKRMAKYETNIDVFRDGTWTNTRSSNLYPGDVVSVPQNGFKAPCDMVLISGSAIVDETSLTGESLPVVKLKITDDPRKYYNAEKDKSVTIYSGTNVIGAVPATDSKKGKHAGRVLAVVTRTGWKTAKGHLVRSILNVKPVVYKYQREAIGFLVFLIVVGIGLFFVSLSLWGTFTEGGWDNENILFGFEAIAILVPPMLPALFHVCILAAAKTLKNDWNIYTTDPSRIPLSGKIDVMCFDKTGTLTKDDLDMIGVIPVTKKHQFQDLHHVDELRGTHEQLLSSLVTCHTLGKLDTNLVGVASMKYSGPQVDIKIFEATNWDYVDPLGDNSFPTVSDPNHNEKKLEILKRFEFDPALQRMSAVVRNPQTKETFVVCKGSPEVIRTICRPESLPKNFQYESKRHSQNGCYVLAIAARPAKIDANNLVALNRSDIEGNLDFLGLILLRNELKPDTTEAIRHLKQGRIRSVIITGDNIFTAFYIGKKCRLVGPNRECFIGDVDEGTHNVTFRSAYHPERELDIQSHTIYDKRTDDQTVVSQKDVAIGLTSAAWDEMVQKPESQSFLINDVKIFARMKPLQKEAVVKMICAANHTVGMCGDGANDCAALSAAHCGIALSEAEASVVSPFTARDLRIGSVVDLIREARAALANAFAAFKYTVLYGITQTAQALIAYSYGADLGEYMYIFIDFVFFLPLAYFVVMSQATTKLRDDPPTGRVFGPRTLSSIFGIAAINIGSLFVGIALLQQQPWYTPSSVGDETWYVIPETTTIWQVGAFTYAATAIACSYGSHWRKPFYYNIALLGFVALTLILTTIVIFLEPEDDPGAILEVLSLTSLPLYFRGYIAIIGYSTFFLILFFEKVIVGDVVGDHVRDCVGRGREMEDIVDGPDEADELEEVHVKDASGGESPSTLPLRPKYNKQERISSSGGGDPSGEESEKLPSEDDE